MSYILDALKKSEQERQQDGGPTLQTIHRPRIIHKDSTSLIVILLLLLCILATSIAGYFFFCAYQQKPVEPVAEKIPAEQSTAIAPQQVSAAPKATQPPPLKPVVEFWQLPDPVQTAIPALTFSFHVYSESPERRTIIINKRRVKEGDRINEKLLLEEITKDGVVMRWEQHRFYISVVEGW